MNGHPRDQAKVSVHDRWQVAAHRRDGWAAPNVITLHDYITTSDIDTEYNVMHCHNYYAIVIEPKINAS